MSDFETAFKHLLISLEKDGKVDSISTAFYNLPLTEKVSYTYNILMSEKLLPKLNLTSKCTVKAMTYKNSGNRLFSLKKDKEALIEYTKCIAVAPNNSEELILGFANRSAVLYCLQKYKLCLKDIDKIYDVYPTQLKYKLQERKAKCLIKLGSSEEARVYFMNALVDLPKNSALNNCRRRIENGLKELDQKFEDCACKRGCKNENNILVPQLVVKNQHVPSASNHLRIEYAHKIGRYVVADCDIEPGAILIVENPYASILMPEFYVTHCYHCFTRCLTLLPCEHCTLAMFCSDECYSQSWSRNHRIECKLLSIMSQLKFDKMEILAVRILMIASDNGRSLRNLRRYVSSSVSYGDDDNRIKGFDNNGYYRSTDYGTVHHLVANIEKRSVADLFKRCVIACFILHYLKNYTEYFISNREHRNSIDIDDSMITDETDNNDNDDDDSLLTSMESFVGSLLLRYLCIIPCNAHEISEIVGLTDKSKIDLTYTNIEIGACLCPMLSLVNHSCNPNVVRHTYKDTVVLHCIEPIKAGQQVYDNYGYHYALHPLRDRQVHLCLQYHFKCECEACQFNWPLYKNIPFENPSYITGDEGVRQKLKESSELFGRTIQKVIRSDIEGQLDILYKYLTLLYENVKRPWKEYNDCQEAIKQCLALKSNHYNDKEHVIL